MEVDRHGQRWTMWFLWKEDVKLLDIHCWLSAQCGEKGLASSIVFSCVWRFNIVKETTQVVVWEWYCNTNEWFFEAMQKL
jgi:hypothetical protein